MTTNLPLSKVGELRYKPWGGSRASGYAETLTLTDKRFTGQRWESGTGLYHYGARWYDVQTGRFTQPDTIVPSQQGVQAWDRFAYGLSNPVKYIDPSGHVACVDEECGIVEHPISGKLISRAGNASPTFNLDNNKGGNSSNRVLVSRILDKKIWLSLRMK